jgi:hypothetical protein
VPVPLAAYNARVRIGGVILCATKWEVSAETNLLEVFCFEAIGFSDYLAGMRKAEYTLSGWYDAQQNMWDPPVGLQDGAIISNVRLYDNGLNSPYWSFPTSIIRSAKQTADVKDFMRFDITGVAKLAYYYPSGPG